MPSKGVRPPTRHPSRTLPRRKASGACLPRHLWPCAAIPGTVSPSLALQSHPQHCGACVHGTPPRRSLCSPSSPFSKTLESGYGQRPDAGTDRTTLEVASGLAQESPRRVQGSGFVRTTIKSRVLHTGTTNMYKGSCDTLVSRLPLVYKRRRWPPSQGDGTTLAHVPSHTIVSLILALASITQ
jgi:hypothetical protein